MNHYTYLIMYPDGTLYHGVRSCECDIRDDEYWGSSLHTPNYSDATKVILSTHKSREEAVAEEIKYHKEINVKSDSRYHNKANQTSLGFDSDNTGIKFSTEHRANLSAAHKGNKHSEDTKAKMSGKNHPLFGKDNFMSDPKWQRTCPHCDKTLAKSMFSRWHGENCKLWIANTN